MTDEVLFRRVETGKRVRYEAVGVGIGSAYYANDVMTAGQCRLEYVAEEGWHRYRYDVTPDTAAFIAAAMIAEAAMIEKISATARFTPCSKTKYTKKQAAILKQHAAEMEEVGLMYPVWWSSNSAFQIARAGIDAVTQYVRTEP